MAVVQSFLFKVNAANTIYCVTLGNGLHLSEWLFLHL